MDARKDRAKKERERENCPPEQTLGMALVFSRGWPAFTAVLARDGIIGDSLKARVRTLVYPGVQSPVERESVHVRCDVHVHGAKTGRNR